MKRKQYLFASSRRPDFVVVEERRENVSLFPHTDQLRKLHEAVDRDFRAPLSQLISRVGPAADDYWKIVLNYAAMMFCYFYNSDRKDNVQLLALPDANMVTRITIAQQITEHTKLGAVHWYKFYGGEDFFHEIRLSGKRLAFSGHALERFNEREDNRIVDDRTSFLHLVYGTHIIGLTINRSNALIIPSLGAFLACIYNETDTEYFVATCLSVKEINSLEVHVPTRAFNLHYGPSFTAPQTRNWIPMEKMFAYQDLWTGKQPSRSLPAWNLCQSWPPTLELLQQVAKRSGVNSDSRLEFQDNIPGPVLASFGGEPLRFDERRFLAEQSQKFKEESRGVSGEFCPAMLPCDVPLSGTNSR